MIDIHIATIADADQRYDTVGDYKTDKSGKKKILVSKMPDERYEFLIAIHELIESRLCTERGISDDAIDDFDMSYEEGRAEGDVSSMPGDQPNAPYHKEHVFATKIEKLIAAELGIDWDTYIQSCAEFTKNNSK